MDNNIDIQWIGFRKDSGKGSIVGWFVLKGAPTVPKWWDYEEDRIAYCFRGKIGKKIYIEERPLTNHFLADMNQLSKNYTTVDPEKVTRHWGKIINDEIEMFIIYLKLKNK